MLLSRRFALAMASGLMLVFTKEPGFMFYGLAVAGFVGLFGFRVERRPRTNSDHHQRLRVIPQLPQSAWLLLLPIISFGIYASQRPPQKDAGGTWETVLGSMLRLDFSSELFRRQLASLLILNFAWVLTSVILGVALWRWRSPRKWFASEDGRRREWLFIYFLFAAGTYCMTRVLFTNNPRYMLPLCPLLIMIFADAICWLRMPPKSITIFLVTLLALFHSSSYWTIDPVSRQFFGTLKFGDHTLLQLPCPESARFYGRGRDQLVYNSQYTYLHYLTNQTFRRFGWNQTYITNDRMTWTGFDDLKRVNPTTSARTADASHCVIVDMRTVSELMQSMDLPQTIYFIEYPSMIDAADLTRLCRCYEILVNHDVRQDGYAVRVVQLRRRSESTREIVSAN